MEKDENGEEKERGEEGKRGEFKGKIFPDCERNSKLNGINIINRIKI